jgi:hypothetical protein
MLARKGSHVSERQYGAGDLTIAFFNGRYPQYEPPVLVAKIGPRFHSACDDLAALLFQTGQATENRNIAGRPANVRWREAKHIRRRLVEAPDHEVASQDDDGNFNGIEDIEQIGRHRVCGRVVAADCPETSPATIDGAGLSAHQAAPEAE